VTATLLSCEKNGTFDRSKIDTLEQIVVKLSQSTYVDDRGPPAEPAGNERIAWQISDSPIEWKKALGVTLTLHAGCTAEPEILAPPQTLSRGIGRLKFNQLATVITCIYRPSLVKIDARNFE